MTQFHKSMHIGHFFPSFKFYATLFFFRRTVPQPPKQYLNLLAIFRRKISQINYKHFLWLFFYKLIYALNFMQTNILRFFFSKYNLWVKRTKDLIKKNMYSAMISFCPRKACWCFFFLVACRYNKQIPCARGQCFCFLPFLLAIYLFLFVRALAQYIWLIVCGGGSSVQMLLK